MADVIVRSLTYKPTGAEIEPSPTAMLAGISSVPSPEELRSGHKVILTDAEGNLSETYLPAYLSRVSVGALEDLTTEAKTSLVAAINEAASTGGSGAANIDDSQTSLTTVYSSSKVAELLTAKANSGLDLVATYTTGDFATLDFSQVGLYRVRAGTGYVTGLPSASAAWWHVVVLYVQSPTDANTMMMLATSSISNTAYYRAKYGATWGSWLSWASYSTLSIANDLKVATPTTTARVISGSVLAQAVRYLTTGNESTAMTELGQALATASDAGAARTLLGTIATEDPRLSDARPPTAHTHVWADLTDKPATFAPAPHNHVVGDVTGLQTTLTDLQTAVDGKVSSSDPRLSDARTPVAHTHPVTDLTATGRTASNYLRGDGTWATPTNTTYQNITTTDITSATTTPQRTVTGDLLKQAIQRWTTGSLTTANSAFGQSLNTAADAAAARTVLGAVADTDPRLTDARTPTAHTHAIGDVTGLQTALDGKASTTHSHDWASITSKPTTFAPAPHVHDLDDLNVSGTPSATTYLRGDGTWATPAGTGGTQGGDINSTQILDSTNIGRAVLTAATVEAARAAIGAGTSDLVIGTAATEAKAGNWVPDWADVTNKPTTFAPSAHTHTAAQISDATTTGRSVLTAANASAARTAIGAGTSSLAIGTTSSTAKAGDWLPAWTEVTGKPTTFTPAAHTHLWADITDKPTTFTPVAHTHSIADVTGLQTALDGKAATGHTHTIANVTGLQTALDGKAPASHTHLWADLTDKPTTFPPSTHTHTAAQLSDSTGTGRSILTASDVPAVRALLGIVDPPEHYEVDLGDGDDPNGAPVDRTTEVQQAFAARSARLGPGVWRVSSQIIANKLGNTVVLDDARIITSYTAAHPFKQAGDVLDAGRSVRLITAGATAGSTVITTDTAGVVVGDWLLIRSSDQQENDPTAVAGMTRKVVAISGSDVTLDIPLYRSLPTTPSCVRIGMAGPWRILGTGTFEHATPASAKRAMIQAFFAERPYVDTGITIGPHGGPGVEFANTIDGLSRASFRDLINDGANGNYGYGVNDAGASRGTTVLGGTARNVRHAFTTNSHSGTIHTGWSTGKYGEPEDYYVGGGYTAIDCQDAGFDTHEPGRRGYIEVRAIDCAIGAQDRATDTTVVIKSISYPTLYGIHIAASSVRSVWHDLRVTDAISGPPNGQAFIRARAKATIVAPYVPDAVSGWSAVNSDSGADLTFVGSGLVAGIKVGTGAVLTSPLGLSTTAYNGAAQTDLRAAAAAYGLVPASGNLDLSLGTGVITSGTLTSSATVQGRFLRGVATNVADVVGRFDGMSGHTGDLLQARVNGANKFAIYASGAAFFANTTTPSTPSTGSTLFASGGSLRFIKSDGTVVDLSTVGVAPTWDSITGKPATFTPSTHQHVVADVTGLQTALDGKVDTTDPRLTDARTPTAHTHTISQVTNLQTELDGKATLWNGAIANDYLYMSPESSKAIEIPYFMNDIAYNNDRGGASRLYVDGVLSGTSLDIVFQPTSSARSLPVSGVTEYVVEIDCWRTFTYGTKVGIAVNESWRAKYIKIEAWDLATSAWKLCHEDSNNPTGDLIVGVPGNSNQGFNKLRYTFRDFNSTQSMRIGQLFVINYASDMGAGPFLPRGGGDVYGNINGVTPTAAAHLTRKDYVDGLVATKADASALAVPRQAQANLTGSGVNALAGAVNGTNKVFTVPDGSLTAGTVSVFLNGVLQVPGEAVTWNTSTGAITFVEAPATGDQIFVSYQIGGGGTGTAPANQKGYVEHGSNANMARPAGYASVEWVGTVAPLNATASDTWLDIS